MVSPAAVERAAVRATVAPARQSADDARGPGGARSSSRAVRDLERRTAMPRASRRSRRPGARTAGPRDPKPDGRVRDRRQQAWVSRTRPGPGRSGRGGGSCRSASSQPARFRSLAASTWSSTFQCGFETSIGCVGAAPRRTRADVGKTGETRGRRGRCARTGKRLPQLRAGPRRSIVRRLRGAWTRQSGQFGPARQDPHAFCAIRRRTAVVYGLLSTREARATLRVRCRLRIVGIIPAMHLRLILTAALLVVSVSAPALAKDEREPRRSRSSSASTSRRGASGARRSTAGRRPSRSTPTTPRRSTTSRSPTSTRASSRRRARRTRRRSSSSPTTQLIRQNYELFKEINDRTNRRGSRVALRCALRRERVHATWYEIPIETPIQPKMDVSPFQRVLIAGFVAGGSRRRGREPRDGAAAAQSAAHEVAAEGHRRRRASADGTGQRAAHRQGRDQRQRRVAGDTARWRPHADARLEHHAAGPAQGQVERRPAGADQGREGPRAATRGSSPTSTTGRRSARNTRTR